MEYDLTEVIEILDDLLLNGDLPSKSKSSLSSIVVDLKSHVDVEKLLKIQDDLEFFTNSANVDSFVRNEVMNVIAYIETLL